jgi:hypothetical protein
VLIFEAKSQLKSCATEKNSKKEWRVVLFVTVGMQLCMP